MQDASPTRTNFRCDINHVQPRASANTEKSKNLHRNESGTVAKGHCTISASIVVPFLDETNRQDEHADDGIGNFDRP